jgi:hypothetical protein
MMPNCHGKSTRSVPVVVVEQFSAFKQRDGELVADFDFACFVDIGSMRRL